MTAPRHKWTETRRTIDLTERTCGVCRLVKITVHPPRGFPFLRFRHPGSLAEIELSVTPPCRADVSVMADAPKEIPFA